MADLKEFLFVDESGDPGWPDGSAHYFLVGMHVSEDALHHVRKHLTAFRYHHDILKEFKDTSWADKFTGPTLRLLEFLAHMTDEGAITTTANWLEKAKYRANGGPHLYAGAGNQFRAFQLRLLLERHRPRCPWGERLDVVIDRWRLNLEQRRNLEDYLRGNYGLRPVISTITMVDSLYSEIVQATDIYTRLIRRIVLGRATPEETSLAGRLMDAAEITRGLY